MGLFGNVFNNEKKEKGTLPQEIVESVHVMQDDLDEMRGKRPSTVSKTASSEIEKSNHPFLGSSGEPSPKPGASKPLSKQVSPAGMPPVPIPAPAPKTPQKKGKSVLPILPGILFLALIIGSVVVFFRSSRFDPESVAPPEHAEETLDPETEAPTKILPTDVPVFSVDKPNLMQIDPETDGSDPQKIALKFDALEQEILAAGIDEPLEFLIRDINNNPIAFSRIAYLFGLSIPEEPLAALDETFSLYFVPENGILRSVLVVDVKDPAVFALGVKKEEAVLPKWFLSLLYRKLGSAPEKVTFNDGSFGAIKTRYVILDRSDGLSLDYALLEKKFVVGTSKDSFRSVLGKVINNGLE